MSHHVFSISKCILFCFQRLWWQSLGDVHPWTPASCSWRILLRRRRRVSPRHGFVDKWWCQQSQNRHKSSKTNVRVDFTSNYGGKTRNVWYRCSRIHFCWFEIRQNKSRRVIQIFESKRGRGKSIFLVYFSTLFSVLGVGFGHSWSSSLHIWNQNRNSRPRHEGQFEVIHWIIQSKCNIIE